MNPSFFQSIKLMELPAFELRERIEQELEQNPALEIINDSNITQLEKDARLKKKEKHEIILNPGRRAGEKAAEEHMRFIEGALTRAETLQEHLLWQLNLTPVDDELRTIAETLIQNLNSDGFHIVDPQTLYKDPPERLNEAIRIIKRLEPVGTCTSDYKESLKVQIELMPNAPSGIGKVLDYLDAIDHEKYDFVSKKTKIDEKKIRHICEYLKKLSPFPGRSFSPGEIHYVIPDIRVTNDQGNFIIKINDEAFPDLGINPYFKKLGKAESKDANPAESDAHEFARKNVREARIFITHLNKRNKTLMRVTQAIVNLQREFFLKGPKYLSALTLAEIAKILDVHETTISRTANGKYMQTDWGIFEIRYFFSNAINRAGSNGSKFSKMGVKETIKEILSTENRALSDKEISAMLNQKGIALARRTVAKYRSELDMDSSYTRKVQNKN